MPLAVNDYERPFVEVEYASKIGNFIERTNLQHRIIALSSFIPELSSKVCSLDSMPLSHDLNQFTVKSCDFAHGVMIKSKDMFVKPYISIIDNYIKLLDYKK